MAVAMSIFPSAYAGILVQALLYLGTTLVIYATLKEKNRRVALLAALLWTISLPVITELNDDSGELAAAFFLSLGLFQLRKGWQASNQQNWLLAGVFMGLAALSRTVLLGVALGLGIAFLIHGLWSFSPNKRERPSHALAFLLMVGLVFAPWLIRNSLAFGQPVLGSTLTGYNVFRMNSILANDNYYPHYVGADEGFIAVQRLIAATPLIGLENEAQMQDLYMQAGLKTDVTHPTQ
jgi:4-amino-4-deoxy-L-arabinose transferase-like glycosyltransferase